MDENQMLEMMLLVGFFLGLFVGGIFFNFVLFLHELFMKWSRARNGLIDEMIAKDNQDKEAGRDEFRAPRH